MKTYNSFEEAIADKTLGDEELFSYKFKVTFPNKETRCEMFTTLRKIREEGRALKSFWNEIELKMLLNEPPQTD